MAPQFTLAFAMAVASVNHFSSAFVLPIATAPHHQSIATRTAQRAGRSLASLPVAETAGDVVPDSQTLSEVRLCSCATEEGSGGASVFRWGVGGVNLFHLRLYLVNPLFDRCSRAVFLMMCGVLLKRGNHSDDGRCPLWRKYLRSGS